MSVRLTLTLIYLLDSPFTPCYLDSSTLSVSPFYVSNIQLCWPLTSTNFKCGWIIRLSCLVAGITPRYEFAYVTPCQLCLSVPWSCLWGCNEMQCLRRSTIASIPLSTLRLLKVCPNKYPSPHGPTDSSCLIRKMFTTFKLGKGESHSDIPIWFPASASPHSHLPSSVLILMPNYLLSILAFEMNSLSTFGLSPSWETDTLKSELRSFTATSPRRNPNIEPCMTGRWNFCIFTPIPRSKGKMLMISLIKWILHPWHVMKERKVMKLHSAKLGTGIKFVGDISSCDDDGDITQISTQIDKNFHI